MTDTRPPEARSPEAATAGEAAAPGHAHPTEGKYIQIALILAVITAAEVATFYFDDELGDFMVPSLIAMMIAKFAMVAMWFMHLKFDSRLFSRLFVTGIIVAVSVYIAALATFQYFD